MVATSRKRQALLFLLFVLSTCSVEAMGGSRRRMSLFPSKKRTAEEERFAEVNAQVAVQKPPRLNIAKMNTKYDPIPDFYVIGRPNIKLSAGYTGTDGGMARFSSDVPPNAEDARSIEYTKGRKVANNQWFGQKVKTVAGANVQFSVKIKFLKNVPTPSGKFGLRHGAVTENDWLKSVDPNTWVRVSSKWTQEITTTEDYSLIFDSMPEGQVVRFCDMSIYIDPPSNNLALGKSVIFTGQNAIKSKTGLYAVDGSKLGMKFVNEKGGCVPSPCINSGGMQGPATNPKPWLRIDLGVSTPVDHVVVYRPSKSSPFTDSWMDELRVIVSDTPCTVGKDCTVFTSEASAKSCEIFPKGAKVLNGNYKVSAYGTVDCYGLRGRYVYAYFHRYVSATRQSGGNRRSMVLSEIEVYPTTESESSTPAGSDVTPHGLYVMGFNQDVTLRRGFAGRTLQLAIQSAGTNDKPKESMFLVNTQHFKCTERGHHVLVLTPFGHVVEKVRFDTVTPAGGNALRVYLEKIIPGYIVMVLVHQTTSGNVLKASDALRNLGAPRTWIDPGKDAGWSLIGCQGCSEKTWVVRARRPAAAGPAIVHSVINLPDGGVYVQLISSSSGRSMMMVNGQDYSKGVGTGHTVLVLDQENGKVIAQKTFNTAKNAKDVTDMRTFLDAIESGRVVIVLIHETTSAKMNAVIPELVKLGGSGKLNPGDGNTFVLIGCKNCPKKSPNAIRYPISQLTAGKTGSIVNEIIPLGSSFRLLKMEMADKTNNMKLDRTTQMWDHKGSGGYDVLILHPVTGNRILAKNYNCGKSHTCAAEFANKLQAAEEGSIVIIARVFFNQKPMSPKVEAIILEGLDKARLGIPGKTMERAVLPNFVWAAVGCRNCADATWTVSHAVESGKTFDLDVLIPGPVETFNTAVWSPDVPREAEEDRSIEYTKKDSGACISNQWFGRLMQVKKGSLVEISTWIKFVDSVPKKSPLLGSTKSKMNTLDMTKMNPNQWFKARFSWFSEHTGKDQAKLSFDCVDANTKVRFADLRVYVTPQAHQQVSSPRATLKGRGWVGKGWGRAEVQCPAGFEMTDCECDSPDMDCLGADIVPATDPSYSDDRPQVFDLGCYSQTAFAGFKKVLGGNAAFPGLSVDKCASLAGNVGSTIYGLQGGDCYISPWAALAYDDAGLKTNCRSIDNGGSGKVVPSSTFDIRRHVGGLASLSVYSVGAPICRIWSTTAGKSSARANCLKLPDEDGELGGARITTVRQASKARQSRVACPAGSTMVGCSCRQYTDPGRNGELGKDKFNCMASWIDFKTGECVANGKSDAKQPWVVAVGRCTDRRVVGVRDLRSKRTTSKPSAKAEVKCPFGYTLTDCNCYSDATSDGIGFTEHSSCNGAKHVDNSCRVSNGWEGNGVYALARCVLFAGVDRPVGLPGVQGLMGAQGAQGPRGFPGPVGDEGPSGPKGYTSPNGRPATPRGPTGPQGFIGDVGKNGKTGPKGPRGPTGEDGDTGRDGRQLAWGKPGDKGPQGAQGDRGQIGPKGYQGDQGIRGPTGNQGLRGDKGVKGPIGIVGLPGDDKYVGAPQGPQGDQGPRGIIGRVGDRGPQGPQGAKGITGDMGPQGHRGKPEPKPLALPDLHGNVLHFDANHNETVMENEALTKVTAWTDVSGHNHGAKQVEEALQPSVKHNCFGKRDCVVFDKGHYLDIADDKPLTVRHVFAVFRAPNPTFDNLGCILGTKSHLGGSQRNYLFNKGTTSFYDQRYPYKVRKNGKELRKPYDIGPINEWMVLYLNIDNAESTNFGRLLGKQGDNQTPFELAEILAFSKVDYTDDEIAAVELYLTRKWIDGEGDTGMTVRRGPPGGPGAEGPQGPPSPPLDDTSSSDINAIEKSVTNLMTRTGRLLDPALGQAMNTYEHNIIQTHATLKGIDTQFRNLLVHQSEAQKMVADAHAAEEQERIINGGKTNAEIAAEKRGGAAGTAGKTNPDGTISPSGPRPEYVPRQMKPAIVAGSIADTTVAAEIVS